RTSSSARLSFAAASAASKSEEIFWMSSSIKKTRAILARVRRFADVGSVRLCLLQLLQSAAGALGERGKRNGVAHGDVGEHFAVEGVACRFQSGDELRVRHSVEAGGGVDARDPQSPEITFAIFAAGECAVERLLDLLFRDAVTARLHPVVATGQLQDFYAAVLSLWSSFD